MDRRIVAISLQLALASQPGIALAATLVVDPSGGGDFVAIQPALTAAAPGDTVRVAAGTYAGPQNTNLTFAGKNLVLRAPFGPAATIIDGEGVGGGFRFDSGETSAAVVDGFTIRRAPDGSPVRVVSGSSPTFRNCVIRDNDVTNSDGGAIHVAAASSPAFFDCTIVENSSAGHAGGVYVLGGAALFSGCLIIGNDTDGRGGGVWLDGAADVSIVRCTISGNSADLAGAGLAGGGLLLTGTASATVNRSIIWGNRAGQGDDVFASANASAVFNCCDIDDGGAAGPGELVYAQDTVFDDPHFCLPAYCRPSPWQDGDYTLAANSPCLAANSACGLSIGALGAGCDAVTVWTGGAGTTDWSNPQNWSTLALPGPGDHVQLNKGNIRLDIPVSIGVLTQCPEASAPDTLLLVSGSLLALGDYGPGADKVDPRASTFSGVTRSEDGEASTAANPHPGVIITPWGVFSIWDLIVRGEGDWTNEGRIAVDGGGQADFDSPLDNNGRGTPGPGDKSGRAGLPRGLFVLDGAASLTAHVNNRGDFVVGAGTTLTVEDTLQNRWTGVVTVAGDIAGPGAIVNWGVIERAGSSGSTIAPALDNRREPVPTRVGEVRVASGTLDIAGAFVNHGLVTVATGATLAFDGTLENRADGVVALAGDFGGTGRFDNLGLVQRSGQGASGVSPLFDNRFDSETAVQGLLEVQLGSLSVVNIHNSGRVTVSAGATLAATGTLANLPRGILLGAGTFDVSAADFLQDGSVSPGLSPGVLTVAGDYPAGPQSALRIEIDGPTAGVGHDQLAVTGAAALGGALHVRVGELFAPATGDSFTIITFGGGGAKTAPSLKQLSGTFDCVSGTDLPGGIYLDPVTLSDRVVLVARQGGSGNQPPVAQTDTFTVGLVASAVLPVLGNDLDPDDDGLSLLSVGTAASLGAAFITDGGATITYLPPAGFAGRDSLTYVVTDCRGALASSTVVVDIADLTGVAGDPPSPVECRLYPVAPNPFNPRARIRYHLPAAGAVEVDIHDARGRLVRGLAAGWHVAGDHAVDWDGRDDRGRPVASGVYFVRLAAPARAETRKMMLLR